MCRVVRKRSIDQMITRSFDQGKKAESQNKTMWLKESVTVTPFALQSNCVGDGAIYSRLPNCCERKRAVDRAVTDHGDLTVEIRKSVNGEFSWRKWVTTNCKGICRNSWRKCVRCPRRLRVPSLNKIAQTECDRLLYGNFAQRIVSGI